MKKSNRARKKNLVVIISVLVIIFGAAAFFMLQKNEPIIDLSDESMEVKFTSQGNLYFISTDKTDTLAQIEIEIADTDALRARGLMYRKTLPANAGMLFTFDREEIQSFWMKNTYISLDMLFVNADYEIVTIHSATAPLQEWSYASDAPAKYVVEVNAGFTNANGIKTGDRVSFERK